MIITFILIKNNFQYIFIRKMYFVVEKKNCNRKTINGNCLLNRKFIYYDHKIYGLMRQIVEFSRFIFLEIICGCKYILLLSTITSTFP